MSSNTRKDLIDKLQDVRILLLAEEEHERARAERRLIAWGLEPRDVIHEDRYRYVYGASLAVHAAIGRLVTVLQEPLPPGPAPLAAVNREMDRTEAALLHARKVRLSLIERLDEAAIDLALTVSEAVELIRQNQGSTAEDHGPDGSDTATADGISGRSD